MPTATARTELPGSYVPGDHEAAMMARWLEAGVFHAVADGDPARSYCILIPPPNVTAALHLGHALNNTLQDLLIRVHRMRGFNTLWMPGTDHAGIATQTVVEKRLLAEGTRREEMGRAAFVARVQDWKDEYERTITLQLKSLGASCDWDRQRFTMDPVCARAVREAFFRLFSDGLIYRGQRIVNWDPLTRTALADDEVEAREVDGHFWYLRYPLLDAAGGESTESVTVATTRPETMLGDTAVAVNPGDPARAPLIGRRVRIPIVNRVVPVIGDAYVLIPDPQSSDVKAQYASGFLKVTPAHDPNDWLIGERHGLPAVNVMAPDASISDRHGWDDCPAEARAFIGLSREKAREAVVRWFRAHGRLEAVRDYRHSVGFGDRSHVAVEPYLSDQWFVRVTDDRLVGEAQRALAPEQGEGPPPARAAGSSPRRGDGEMRFFPARYARIYQGWHENLRDWCISRQLWWGHRIPVWTRAAGAGAAGPDEANAAGWEREGRLARRSFETPAECLDCVCVRDAADREVTGALEAAGFERDPDVLDTWFSSGLWPLSTMGWPRPNDADGTRGLLETFNPTSVLSTAREIVTLWVSRMVMFNRYFLDGRVPFRDVYIHPIIQDGHGQKMSKSLGNGVDPRDIVRTHGADALRFTLVKMATSTQDVRLPVDSLCPRCQRTFHPREITAAEGARVAAPRQTCPGCGQALLSAYGVASGTVQPTEAEPLALNSAAQFDRGRNFANKLWNATRFALAALPGGGGDPELDPRRRPLVDRWILSRLQGAARASDAALGAYQLSVYVEKLEQFLWSEFCDWYLEAVKPTIHEQPGQQQVLRTVLNATLRLLHPLCPFVTEALWPHVRAAGAAGVQGVRLPDSALLAGAAWPEMDEAVHAEEAEATFRRVQKLVNAVRTVRSRHRVHPRRTLALAAPPPVRALIAEAGGVVESQARLEAVEAAEAGPGDPGPASRIGAFLFEGHELCLEGLADAVDAASERQRIEKLIRQREDALAGFRAKLANAAYVENAPPAVVEETRRRGAEAEADLAAARRTLAALDERP